MAYNYIVTVLSVALFAFPLDECKPLLGESVGAVCIYLTTEGAWKVYIHVYTSPLIKEAYVKCMDMSLVRW